MDDAIMRLGEADALRADVAFTVFLSDPDDYQGGALVIEATDGERAYRLPAGAALVYPANTSHRVETVTGGERLVAAGWAQSFVREPDRREMLFDLTQALADAEAKGAAQAAKRLRKTVSNLLRMWAEV
jgi:PKHD-type hydroxylase